MWEVRAWSQYLKSDTPPSQSQSRQDLFLSSLSDVCQDLISSEAKPNTTSHTLSKHDTSRGFNGQRRIPPKLKKKKKKSSSGAKNSSSYMKSIMWRSDVLNWHNHSHTLKISSFVARLQKVISVLINSIVLRVKAAVWGGWEKEKGRQISGKIKER